MFWEYFPYPTDRPVQSVTLPERAPDVDSQMQSDELSETDELSLSIESGSVTGVSDIDTNDEGEAVNASQVISSTIEQVINVENNPSD